MIAIIDYDAGNIKNVEKALQFLGEETVVTRDSAILLSAEKVILPGVGSFGAAMENLRRYGLEKVIFEIVDRRIPLLGICLGLHLLFEESQEGKGIKGLGLLKGKILKIPAADGLKIPQIGWNSLSYPNPGVLFQGIPENAYVYFVHSYYLQAKDESIVTAVTEYGRTLHVSVEMGNIYACQFHPEKSSETGLKILKNFVSIGRGE